MTHYVYKSKTWFRALCFLMYKGKGSSKGALRIMQSYKNKSLNHLSTSGKIWDDNLNNFLITSCHYGCEPIK